MIDLANFKDIKDEFKIMSVPALIVNNKDVYFGSKNRRNFRDNKIILL